MGAPTTALTVTKLCQQTLHMKCSKAIASHLRSEAIMGPKLRSNVTFTACSIRRQTSVGTVLAVSNDGPSKAVLKRVEAKF